MKIILINLPQLNSIDDKLDPPLGLMYIAAMLRSRNIDIKIIDLSFIDKKDWKEKIGYADVYGITVFSASLYLAIEVAKIVKEINSKCKTVVGGPHPTSLPEQTLKFFDCVITGEGEFAPLDNIDKLNGIINMPQIKDLSTILPPARDLVNIKEYHRKVCGKQATSLTTSRGCPYKCAFCYKDVFGNRVRNFSIDSIVEEIKSIKTNYDIHALIIYDDTFALNRKRFYALCDEFKKLNIIFRANGDARHNTLEDFQMLYSAGCRELEFGIESGSQKILDNIHKGVTVKQNMMAIKNAQKAGLIVKSFLMVGNPGETKETIEETKRFIVEANPDQFTLFTLIPLPGCDIWKNPDKYKVKITSTDFKEYYSIAGNYDAGAVVNTEELTAEEIKQLKGELVDFLKGRGQRGILQDYYKKV
jgi:radical SAM superfamily enzyme YgiQ (UPF0313 family)